MISVVIPLYNKEASIANTLNSVLAQTYQNFEIVVVDDGSTDSSAAIVETFKDTRIRLIRQSNGGVSAARNTGIREAKGEYVAFLDADDEWMDNYLEEQNRLTSKYPECSVFATNYELRYDNGRIVNTIINGLTFSENDGVLYNYFDVASKSNPPICSTAVMTRRDAVPSIGGFPVGVAQGEDLLTWTRLALRYKIAYSRKPLARYNLRSTHSVANAPLLKVSEKDEVGDVLYGLYKGNSNVQGLSNYLSRWHKIRSMHALRNCQRLLSCKEAVRALYFNPFNLKMYPVFFLVFLPKEVIRNILSKLHR